MKRAIISLILALALLTGAAASAEYIGGEGWWEEDYNGAWQYYPVGGLYFKLPIDWGDDFGDDDTMLFCRDDYYITLSVSPCDVNLYELEGQIDASGGWWNGDHYDEWGMIILKDDRDWLILANAYSMCAFTYSDRVQTVEFCFGYEEDDACRTIVRRIISSVEA